MDRQIIEISNNGFLLSLYRGFLVIENEKKQKQEIPLDNILSLILSADNAVISKNIVNAVIEQGGNIIFCDKKYLPSTIAVPYTGHWLTSHRIKQQIDCSRPLQKNLWKSIVQHKILNQAYVLEYFFPDNKNIERLKILAKDTLSDDARNNEGMAAALYFKSLFGKKFVRNRLNPDINILLNYAYTILRAMVARAVSGNGLLPYLGLKHCGKTNSLPLVDDLIEPFRAIADKLVFDEVNKIVDTDNIELNTEPPEQPLIPAPHPGRQARVVLHGKVEVQGVALPGPADPLPVKPVLRPLRVAGEPQPAPLHGAPGAGLFHEGAGHESRLIQQHSRQGNALNEGGAALVLAAHEVEAVFPLASFEDQQVFAAFFPALKAQLP